VATAVGGEREKREEKEEEGIRKERLRGIRGRQ